MQGQIQQLENVGLVETKARHKTKNTLPPSCISHIFPRIFTDLNALPSQVVSDDTVLGFKSELAKGVIS